MNVQQVEDLPLSGRIVAFDLGEVRIGVALSDPGQVIASPFETLTVPRGDDNALVGALERAIGRHDAAGVVIGLPRRPDGRDGAAAHRARAVAAAVADRTDAAVVLWDERYTTVEAERSLIEADLSRTRRREVIDQVAASVILQSVLDAQLRRRTAQAATAADSGDVKNSTAKTDSTDQEQTT